MRLFRVKSPWGLLLVAMVCWLSANAQSQSDDSVQVRLPRGEGWSHPEAEDRLEMGLRLGTTSYFREDTQFFQKRGTKSQISDLVLALDYEWHGVFDGAVNFKNRIAVEEQANYFMPKNLYAGWSGKGWQFWMGRKWYKWSEADEQLQRGLYQGRFMNDKLRKDSHGLTGFFVENNWRNGSLLLFASPMFVPEFGPDHDIIGGDFYSPNPYFRPPSSSLEFLGVNTPMKYRVINPAESEVVLNESFATRLEQNWGSWFARGSYAYKPMSQLLLAGQFLFQHTEVGAQDIRVNVYPRVQYHHLSSLEAGFSEAGGLTTWMSYTYERPEQDDIPKEWTFQDTGRSGIFAAYIGHDLSAGPRERTHAYFSYSRVDGGDRPDAGEFTARETLFERRYQFYETVELGLQNGYWLLNKNKFSWSARAIFDFVQQGAVFLADASWSWGPQWQVYGMVDLLGIVDDERAQFADGFLGEYRSNDRVSLGVSYVF